MEVPQTFSGILGAAPAVAERCVIKKIGDACDTQVIQASKPDYLGKKAPTPKNMVCLTALAEKPSALVLAKGRVEEGARVDGKVITSWRIQSSHWKKTSRGYEREICIPAHLLQGTVTLCNEQNRSVWNSNDVQYLKRVKRVPSQDATCLLGKKTCAKYGL